MAEQKTERAFKQIVIPRVKLVNPGDSAEGYFRGLNEVQGKKGVYNEALLQKEGSRDMVTISLGVVADKAFKTIAEGEYVRLTLMGNERSGGGNLVNLYKIEVATAEE